MRSTAVALTLILTAALVGCSHEGADWKAASTANTPEAYQQFLQQHPSGVDADQARERIAQLAEDHDWQVAAGADTREAYEQFVTQHADSKWAQEARIRIENFAQAATAGGAAADTAVTANAPQTSAPPAATTSALPHIQAPVASSAAPPGKSVQNVSAPASPHTSAAHAVATNKVVAHTTVRNTHNAAHAAAPTRVVQLGAYHTKSRAESEWKTLSARFPTQLKKLQPLYVASKSKAGQVYRLQVKAPSPGGAKDLCAALKRRAQACVPVTAAVRQSHVTA